MSTNTTTTTTSSESMAHHTRTSSTGGAQNHALGDAMYGAATMLERTISSMQKQLEDQAQLIQHLQRDMHARPTHDELLVTHERIFERLGQLESRVNHVEQAITVPMEHESSEELQQRAVGDAQTSTIGSFVAHQQRKLAALEDDLKERATASNFEHFKQDMQGKMDEFLDGARNDFTSTTAFQNLVDSHQNVESELSALQGVVSCKVDKSEMRRYKAILQGIEDHASFHQKVSEHMTQTEEKLGELDSRVSHTEQRLDNHDSSLHGHSQDLNRKVDLSRFGDLVSSVESLRGDVENKAPLQETQEFQDNTKKKHKELLEWTSSLKKDLEELEQSHNSVAHDLSQRPTFDDLSKKVDFSEYKDFTTSCQDSLSVCAHQDDCNRVERLLQHHANVQNMHHKKIDIAMKFIDWYGSKGEAYEYNAASLERHMNSLAVGNRSRVRQAPPGTQSEKFLNELDANRVASYSSGAPSPTTQGESGYITGTAGVRIGGISYSSTASDTAAI